MTLPVANTPSDALEGISSVLGTPVHVLQLILLGVLVYELGGLLIEVWRRVKPSARPVLETASLAIEHPFYAEDLSRRAPGPLTELAVRDLAVAAQIPGDEAIESALTQYELRIQRKLDRTRILVRAGPALGLMGTLIPLAPGLSALGDGDFKKLAGDLTGAFAATVVGILVGTGAYVLTLVRTRFYTEDLSALEGAVTAHKKNVASAQAVAAAPHHRVEATVGGDVQ